MSDAAPHRWLRIIEIAEQLGVSTRTVRRWLHDPSPRRLICMRSGGVVRIRDDVLARWLEARSKGGQV